MLEQIVLGRSRELSLLSLRYTFRSTAEIKLIAQSNFNENQ